MKVIQRVPQPLYEFSGLHDRPIEGVVYNYELVRVTISPETQFQIDKLGAHVTRVVLNNILSSGEDKTKFSTLG